MLTHMSLFAGIGGIDLAAERAGFHAVGQCELADFPTQVLEKHWPDVSRWRDIRDVTRESFRERTGQRTVTLVSGGFPCQPFSLAGKQKGKGDDRYLWPEMLRVIRELAPSWVVCENVPGILRLAGRTVCEDLEREGYSVAIFNFEAAAVGAPHRRERVFFVAHADDKGLQGREREKLRQCADKQPIRANCASAAHAESVHVQGQHDRQREVQPRGSCGGQFECGLGGASDGFPARLDKIVNPWASDWENGVPRVASGQKDRVQRLKALGNAVVPAQVYPILAAIAEIERGRYYASNDNLP